MVLGQQRRERSENIGGGEIEDGGRGRGRKREGRGRGKRKGRKREGEEERGKEEERVGKKEESIDVFLGSAAGLQAC